MRHIKRIYDYLSELPMIIVSGIFLLLSLLNILFKYTTYEFAWVTIFISGTPLVVLAVQRLFGQFFISSALLISIAMFASIFIGEIFAAGEVAFIMALGAWLEDRTTDRAKKGIEKLLKLVPRRGRRIIKGIDGSISEEMVDAKQLRINDVIRILPGETITADGKVISGTSSIDQSIMTGESLPVDKNTGDLVYAGTINCFGSIDISITKDYEDSSIQKMISLVQEAENKQPPMQKIIDKWAQWLVPIVLFIALSGYIITGKLVVAVTILIVFCPCALALATPTCIIAAIGQATKRGVLIKSGEALEKMGKVSVMVFDKTGTITEGRLSLTDIITFGPEKNELLALASCCESRSEHPVGKAIVSYARKKNLPVEEVDTFNITLGKGVRAELKQQVYLCGNEKLFDDYKIHIHQSIQEKIDSLRNQGKAVVIVGNSTSVLGIIALSDQLKEASKPTISELFDTGIKKIMLLTGDNEKTAGYIANQIGIKDVAASLLPEDKVNQVSKLQDASETICMVGDGINDAPALKAADIGVAMGTMGSDIAIDAADIALMGDDIQKITYLKRLSVETIRSIKFNIALSMIINIAAVVLSLYSVLNPVTGAIVHNAGSVLVVLNAARLYDKKI